MSDLTRKPIDDEILNPQIGADMNGELPVGAEVEISQDGNYEATHFKHREFNLACARPLADVVANMLASNPDKKIQIVDAGGAQGDLAFTLYDVLLEDGVVTNEDVDTGKVCFLVLDYDQRKLDQGNRNREDRSITFAATDLTQRESLQESLGEHTEINTDPDTTVLLYSRAVTQYPHPKHWNEWRSVPGFNNEQTALYNNYLMVLPPNSIFVDIISTGTKINGGGRLAADPQGLEIFESILFDLTKQNLDVNPVEGEKPKIDNFLTKKDVEAWVDSTSLLVGSKVKTFETYNAHQFKVEDGGSRGADYMYKRYGMPGETFEDFKKRYISAFANAMGNLQLNAGDFDECRHRMVKVKRNEETGDIEDVTINVVYHAVPLVVQAREVGISYDDDDESLDP